MDFSKAVALAAPNRPFVCNPENYGGLKMLDNGPKPTMQEIQAAWDNRDQSPQPTNDQLLRWLTRNMTAQQRQEAALL